MEYKYTNAIHRIRALKSRKKIIQGGTSAGKTIAILSVLISIAARKKTDISVVSETIPHLRRGCIKDFQKIMEATNRWRDAHWNKSLLIYTFANGSTIEFFSAESEAKLRGARRNVLYVNEANNIDFNSYYQLAIRTSGDIYIDFNPTSEFWAHTEVLNEPDAELIILTYQDNDALDEGIKKDIELAREKAKTSEFWANWWQVMGLGQIGNLTGAVYANWKQISQVNPNAKLIAYGLDFGYSSDPTAMVAMYLCDGKIQIHEMMYTTGLTNLDIVNRLKQFGITRSHEIVADSAEPKSIEEIYRFGFNIKPAIKGADSIRNGIDILNRYEMEITTNSINIIRELRNYVWDTDKNGKSLDVPIDSYNHAMDAIRYVALNKLSKNAGGKYVIM